MEFHNESIETANYNAKPYTLTHYKYNNVKNSYLTTQCQHTWYALPDYTRAVADPVIFRRLLKLTILALLLVFVNCLNLSLLFSSVHLPILTLVLLVCSIW